MELILYDGWSLVHQANSPAALHLLALLSRHPSALRGAAALPGPAPEWLPEHIEIKQVPTPDTAAGRLDWEQRRLPRMQKQLGGGLIHGVEIGAALFGRSAYVLSPAGFEPAKQRRRDLAERLRESMGEGGLARARAVFWPGDLPELERRGSSPLVRLPPLIYPGFTSRKAPLPPDINLPESFILYHGPYSKPHLERLLSAWSWAAGPLGAYYPLLAAGLPQPARAQLLRLAEEYNLSETVQVLAEIPPKSIPAVYQHASVLLHPFETSIWSGPVRQALACGLPVVAAEAPWNDALVGEAGILRPAEDARAMGAALITLVVEESIAETLSAASQKKNPGWDEPEFDNLLLEAYQRLL
jgi:glycosyltransferase involved in cell wall biosynthesis